MATYTVQSGDTLERIAALKYGDPSQYPLILKANPGVVNPPTVGAVLFIPDSKLSASPLGPDTVDADAANEVSLLIDNQRFRYWTSVGIGLSMDSIDTFSLASPWEPDVPIFRDAFVPLAYKPVSVFVGGELVITGTMVTVSPTVKESRELSVGGYSKPGVLNDCTYPPSSYPIEYNGQGLREITEEAVALFGLDVQFDADPGAVFDQIAASAGQKILSFIIGLAKQRGLIVGNTAAGKLLLTKTTTDLKPVAALREGELPLMGVTPTYDGQQFFSHITGLSPSELARLSEDFTTQVPSLVNAGISRPSVFTANDTQGADLQTSVNSRAGRMLAGAIAVSVVVQGWRTPGGDLWQPNTVLRLQSEGAMIYQETSFLIRRVGLRRGIDGDTAKLDLVLPGSFSGVIPEAFPWE